MLPKSLTKICRTGFCHMNAEKAKNSGLAIIFKPNFLTYSNSSNRQTFDKNIYSFRPH